MNSYTVHQDYYKQLFENAYEPILLIDGQCFVDGNLAALNILGMQCKDDLIATHPGQLSPETQPDGQSSHDKANRMIQKCYENGSHQFEWLHQTLQGHTFLVEVTLKIISVNNKPLMHTTWRPLEKEKSLQHSIIQQKKLIEEKSKLINDVKSVLHTDNEKYLFDQLHLLEEYKHILDESAIVSKADTSGKITFVNDKFCQVSGYSREELLGQNHRIVRHPDTDKCVFEEMWRTLKAKKTFRKVIKNKAKDGTPYYVDSTITPILDSHDSIIEYISIRYDITKLFDQDKIIIEQYTDPLTGLPNRVKLVSDIGRCINPKIALINIDNFKDINESYSLDIGDNILQQFSKRLTRLESTNINAYRIAGDTFALLASGNISLEQLTQKCLAILENLSANSFIIDDTYLSLAATIGLASGKDKLLSHAEIAHMSAKRHNKEWAVFDENLPLYKEIVANIQVTKEIKYALKNDKVALFGQKIINNHSKEIKYETLMRLQSEEGRFISPYFFLQQAKKAKLYPELSRKIIEKSCQYFAHSNDSFSINLMIEDIKNESTITFLFETLKRTGTADRVILEIVESEAIETFKEVEDFIKESKALGCKIAIDDFGTGYSNFEYITRLNIDILKIDGSLIKNIHIDKNIFLTVKTIVNFAQVLGLDVVAEFVHCKEVQEIVESLDITYSQGFFFHEPELLE